MSSIIENIIKEMGGGALAQAGAAVGATPQQTASVMQLALPAMIGALAKNASNPAGASALAGALDKHHGPSLMDSLGPIAGMLAGGGGGGGLGSLVGGLLGGGGGGGLGSLVGGLLGGGAPAAGGGGLGSLLGAAASMMGSGNTGGLPAALNGAGILGHMFGGQQSGVTNNVAQAAGVDPSIVAKLLPLLAPVLMSALGTAKQSQGLDAGGLAGLLTGEASKIGVAPKDDGFGVDDLMKMGGQLASSGMLGKLFG
jgi:hypothetical protein